MGRWYERSEGVGGEGVRSISRSDVFQPGFPFWTSRPSPLYTQNLLPGPICCCGPLGMPSKPSAGCARRSRRANRRGSGTFLRHLPHIAPCRRPRSRDAIGRQPAGTGSAQIRWSIAPNSGVVARIVTSPHDANRQDPHLPMRYDTGRPRAVIRLRISQPRTTSLPCPAGLRARRPSPMMDLYRKNVFSTRP